MNASTTPPSLTRARRTHTPAGFLFAPDSFLPPARPGPRPSREQPAFSAAQPSGFDLSSKYGFFPCDTQETPGGRAEPALSRSHLESFYDGTLFYKVANARAQARESAPVDVSDVDFSLLPEAESLPLD